MNNISYCCFCCNAEVEPELSPDNDLSYLRVGSADKEYNMFIRSGNGSPTVLMVSKFDNTINQNVDIAIYKMKYCPECGRKLFENN